MKPFMCGGRRYAFDITNPYDLTRLQRASALLSEDSVDGDGVSVGDCKLDYPAYLRPEAAEGGALGAEAAGILAVCRRYYAFFSVLFPGQAETILGDRPSVSAGRDAFGRWLVYLQDCIKAEKNANDGIVQMYEKKMNADSDTKKCAVDGSVMAEQADV